MNLIHNISREELALVRAHDNLIDFGKLFLPGDFMKSTTPDFHQEIGAELISPSNKPCAILVARGHAKYLSIYENVLTIDGWKEVRDLLPDDYIYGSDGMPKRILGFSDIVEKPLYRVTTRDGRSLKVSDDHLWTVKWLAGNGGKYDTMSTKDMIDKKYARPRYDKRYNSHRIDYMFGIDNPAPVEMPEEDVKIDYYTLGVMIGDGTLKNTTPRITSHNDDIEELMLYIPHKKSRVHYYKGSAPSFTLLDMIFDVKRLGLSVNSFDKFIPKQYLKGSVEQRLELLRGLMDTDGTLATKTSRGKSVYFCTISPRLSTDIVELVRSLGGSATITRHENDHKGYFLVSIKIAMNPFKLKRKADRFVPHDKLCNAIINIESAGIGLVKCIKVDSKDELFIANDYLLTHNTTLVKAKILHDLCFAKKGYEWGLDEKEKFEFFGWCSSNQKKSKNNVAYVKMNLEYNDKMRYYFGKQEGRMLRGDTWNQEDLVTAYGDRLISSSNLTSMRGDTLATIEQGAVRYSCVFIDDAENEENTKSAGSRETITNNIMDGILPAIDTHYPGNRLYLIETIVHFDAFAQQVVNLWNLAKKKGELDTFPWKVIMYPATQPDREGGVLWHSWMPREELDKKKQEYIHSPKGIAGYYQEYELEAQSKEHSIWTRDHVKIWDGYYEWDEEEKQGYLVMDGARHPVNTFIGCDPATDIDTREADFSAIMVIAVDINNNVYVLEYERQRAIPVLAQRGIVDGLPDQIIGRKGVVDYIMGFYEKYHCTSATVEDVAMNRSVFQSLNDRRRIENKFNYAVIPEKPGGRDKRNRIMSGLSGRFSSGTMHYRENMFDLMQETVTFGPRMAHDDTIESLYYACKHAYPPDFTINEQFEYERPPSRKAKDWRLA